MIKNINRMVRTKAVNQFEHRFDNLVDNEGNIPTHHTARQVFDHLKTSGDAQEVRMTEALVLDGQFKSTTIDIRLSKTCLDTYFKTIKSAIYDISILGYSELFVYSTDMLVELALKALRATSIRNDSICDIKKGWKVADKAARSTTNNSQTYRDQRLSAFADHFRPELALELGDMAKDTANSAFSACLSAFKTRIDNAKEDIDVIYSNAKAMTEYIAALG